MQTVTYSIPTIHCAHCTHTIETELGELEGIRSVKADLNTKKVSVTYESPADDAKIKAFLAEIEYPVAA